MKGDLIVFLLDGRCRELQKCEDHSWLDRTELHPLSFSGSKRFLTAKVVHRLDARMLLRHKFYYGFSIWSFAWRRHDLINCGGHFLLCSFSVLILGAEILFLKAKCDKFSELTGPTTNTIVPCLDRALWDLTTPPEDLHLPVSGLAWATLIWLDCLDSYLMLFLHRRQHPTTRDRTAVFANLPLSCRLTGLFRQQLLMPPLSDFWLWEPYTVWLILCANFSTSTRHLDGYFLPIKDDCNFLFTFFRGLPWLTYQPRDCLNSDFLLFPLRDFYRWEPWPWCCDSYFIII